MVLRYLTSIKMLNYCGKGELPVEMQIANISDTFSDQNFYTSHVLFSNKFLSVRADLFALIGYYFKINIFDILTGQKRDMTKLKFVWPVNMTSNYPKIILSPVA